MSSIGPWSRKLSSGGTAAATINQMLAAVRGTITVRGGAGGEQQVRITAGKEAIDRWLQIRGRHPGALLAPVVKGGRGCIGAMTGSTLALCLKTVAKRANVSSLTPTDLRQSGPAPPRAGEPLP